MGTAIHSPHPRCNDCRAAGEGNGVGAAAAYSTRSPRASLLGLAYLPEWRLRHFTAGEVTNAPA
jgi:hypothetical protein